MMIPGINVPETPHKHNYAMWIYPSSYALIYAECSACGESPLNRPSYYCPNCGALMLNVYDARAHYDNMIEGLKEKHKETESASND